MAPAINQQHHAGDRAADHDEHEVNALVVSGRLGVVVLRTEGFFVAGLSGRAGVGRAWVAEQHQKGEEPDEYEEPSHLLPPADKRQACNTL